MVHQFVDLIPEDLEEDTIYVSVRFRTAVHLCACGCGETVVTPIRPHRWHLLFDGEAISLTPSIGSWQLPCRSHYWIKLNRITWAGDWTDEQIEAGRVREAAERARYYETGGKVRTHVTSMSERRGTLARLLRRVTRRKRGSP